MAEYKKTPFTAVNEEIISMEFDGNPNIPTANYSEETAGLIQEAIMKKMRNDKLKKFIDSELKGEQKSNESSDFLGFSFSFKGM